MSIRLDDRDPRTEELYISSGHVRTALQTRDGVIVVFRDGTVTAGPWRQVCRAYPQPMAVVFNHADITALADVGGAVDAARVLTMQAADTVAV